MENREGLPSWLVFVVGAALGFALGVPLGVYLWSR